MTYEDVLQIRHNLYLELEHAHLASPQRFIDQIESQLHLAHQILATYRCSTPTMVNEIMAHPKIEAVTMMIEREARQREVMASGAEMEAAARDMIEEAKGVSAKLRLVK